MDLFVSSWENTDDALDGFGCINRVQRRKHQVSGLGGFERHFHRLAIAHLADQDYLGRLPQSCTQCQRKVRECLNATRAG
jgi:hypothetical protein